MHFSLFQKQKHVVGDFHWLGSKLVVLQKSEESVAILVGRLVGVMGKREDVSYPPTLLIWETPVEIYPVFHLK